VLSTKSIAVHKRDMVPLAAFVAEAALHCVANTTVTAIHIQSKALMLTVLHHIDAIL
jgi:hypothetical protein